MSFEEFVRHFRAVGKIPEDVADELVVQLIAQLAFTNLGAPQYKAKASFESALNLPPPKFLTS